MTTEIAVRFSPNDIACIQEDLLASPQAPANVVHHFGPGLYIREITIPAGALSIGNYQTIEHLNILLKGKLNYVLPDGSITYMEAPYMFVAPPGKKMGFIFEEVVWQNIYATTETDIEKLEATYWRKDVEASKVFDKEFEESILSHQEDRDDFDLLLKEHSISAEEVYKQSHYRGDCIPFPMGTYKISTERSPIEGKGLFASSDIEEGEVIAPARLNEQRTPAGYQINHSKTPNCIGVLNSDNDIYIVANKKIQGKLGGRSGEELTLDYRQTIKLNNKEVMLCPQ